MSENKEAKIYSSLINLPQELWSKNERVHLSANGSARVWICRGIGEPVLAILPDERQVCNFVADAEAMHIFSKVAMLPELPLGENETRFTAQKINRGDLLEDFRYNGGVLAATPFALMTPFSTGINKTEIVRGEVFGRDRLIDELVKKGYERCDLVWTAGQFAIRGSIVDFFSPSDFFPIRVEFFDDEIESIRRFDSETQKSIKMLDVCTLQSLTARRNDVLKSYLPENMRVILFDPNGCDITAENSKWLWENAFGNDKEESDSLEKWEDIYSQLSKYKRIRVAQNVQNCSERIAVNQLPNFRGKLKDVEHYCMSLIRDKYTIKVFSETERSIKWAEINGFDHRNSILSEGFIDLQSKLVFLTDLEFSGITLAKHKIENKAPEDWGTGIIAGQYVVHDDYGVAIYRGTECIENVEGRAEYLVLEFADEKRLLIPVMQFYKISPWSPVPGHEAELDDLSKGHWKKSTAQARKDAQAAAAELIKIYAKREISKGVAFPENAEAMKEITDAFPYKETVDQLRAIDDVERDMSRPVPMDRLIIGDVGFGKTEIAIRAAARAVFAEKQVAVMAPTTLLAHQHYETFTLRFSDTPVRVEVISRFIPKRKQTQILEDLAFGKVDILIGTHRILSQDVKFKDLGLVIIDEEHRFGVMHKEKLKKTTSGADVLMLSATPIPRSLSLSLNGLRDMSLLNTPPQNRLPVITAVRPFSIDLLKKAVLREKNRGGQIYFVHNRINGLEERAVMLKRLFPKLQIALVHSKTDEAELEKTMLDFAARKIDILVCTTIIESGLDIPSANTLIIDDAHELGLAQMYQLRGRVGRREEQAYAFLFYPPDVQLSVDSSERLTAIAELDELGAGYKLAMRDLQIRGGGDLIGIAQHGTSEKIGYPRYCEILAEEIAKIKGEYRAQPVVEIGFPISIPGNYLPQENLRVTLYRRLLFVNYPQEVIELKEETKDRFGKIPPELNFLFDVTIIKSSACDLQIEKIECNRFTTALTGQESGIWKNLKLPHGWNRFNNRITGPGGINGIRDIAAAIIRQIPEIVK